MSTTLVVAVVVVVIVSVVVGLVVALLPGRRRGGRNGPVTAPKNGSGGKGGSRGPVKPAGGNSAPVNSKTSRCPDVQATLQAHNAARARRGAAPLAWDESLASVAQAWSDRGVFKHSNNRYGENLAMGTGNCKQAVDLWVDEEKLWRPGMGFTMKTGHFTQVVWKGTKKVGCGFAKGIVTCNYSPPGNSGNYGGNV